MGRIWRQTLEAVTTTIAILIIAMLAAAAALAALLFAAPQLVANGQWLAIGAACALSGILAAVFYSVRREAEAANWTRLERLLDNRVTPDSGYYTHRLEIRKAGKERDFLDQFANIPKNSREAMLVLRQNASRNPREAGYEAESIRDQVMKADSHLERLDTPHISWLCLTDRKGRFVAYESYDAFRTQALRSGVRGYADVLNLRDIEEFNARIGVHIGSEFAAHALEEGLSKRAALAEMMAQGWDHAMVVSRGDRKPVGVMTLRSLIAEIFPNETAQAPKIEPVAEPVAESAPLEPEPSPVVASAPAHQAVLPPVQEEIVAPVEVHQVQEQTHDEPPSPLATLIAPVSEQAQPEIANVISEPVVEQQIAQEPAHAPEAHIEEHAA